MPDTIAFLGFGEAARAFAATLKERDPTLVLSAYDIKLGGPEREATLAAMAGQGVRPVETAEGLATAGTIFSAVTADQSLAAVLPMLPALGQGARVVDINSVSPNRKAETARRVEATGSDYVDMAVMAPVHPRGHRTPVLVAGHGVEGVTGWLAALGFDFKVAGDRSGAATAIKMVRSVFVKGLEAITVEALLAAEKSGCYEEILASLSASYPGLGWPDIAAYHFERSLRHGTRRAAEMRESAATLDDLGLTGALATAIAEVHARQGSAGADAVSDDLRATVRAALARRG